MGKSKSTAKNIFDELIENGLINEMDINRSLGRILRAIVLLLPDVSYCQGMNYVVAVLLLCALNNGNGNLDEWNPSSLDLIENYFETNDEYCDEIIEI